jgi:hypothetical protein
MRRLAFLSVSLAAAARLAFAQPIGPDFRVSVATTGNQLTPSVAVDKAGGFVVAWHGFAGTGLYTEILARRFDAAGAPIGPEFRVNTLTTNEQRDPSVAIAPDGGFVVAWSSFTAPIAVHWSVMAKRYDSSGTAVTDDYRISTYTTEDGRFPAIARAGNGFVVVWRRGLTQNVAGGRLLDANGVPAGSEFVVNTSTGSSQMYPRVAANLSGSFVVAWKSLLSGVVARRYDASGTPLAAESPVTSSASSSFPSAAMNQRGGFVVAWQQFGNGINAQRFDAFGAPLGGEFRVSSYTPGDIYPSVASDAAGNFVVVWQSNRLGSWDVFGRRYSSAGAPVTDEFRVNSYSAGGAYSEQGGYLVQSPVSSNANGRYVVAWWEINGRLSGDGIYAQRYASGVSGDVSGNGAFDVADVFYLINYLFAGGAPPLGPSDPNADGVIDVSDVFYLINALFAGGAPPH